MYLEMRYIPGDQNTVADFLSRYQSLGVAMIDTSPFCLATLQQQDPEMPKIWQDTWLAVGQKENVLVKLKGHGNQTVIRQGVLCVKVSDKKGRVVGDSFRAAVPKAMCAEILREARNLALCGHGGVFKTHEWISREFFWPYMTDDFAAHIRQCVPCQANSNKGTLPPAPLQSLPIPGGPNQCIHVDLFGPLKSSIGGSKYVLVMMDALTKIVRLKAIPSHPRMLRLWLRPFLMTGYMFMGSPKLFLVTKANNFAMIWGW